MKPDKYTKFLRVLRKHKGEFRIDPHGCIRHKRRRINGLPICPVEDVIGLPWFSGKAIEHFGGALTPIIGAADGNPDFAPLRRRMLRALGLREKAK